MEKEKNKIYIYIYGRRTRQRFRWRFWYWLESLKQETLPEIPTTERVIKSTRNYIESIYVLQQM